MKTAIITDQHFGMRKGNRIFLDYFKKFYDTVFFPTLEKEGIKTVIDMGDTFDNRRTIDLWSLVGSEMCIRDSSYNGNSHFFFG